MTLEVLVATMHQTDYSLLKKLNLCSDAVVVNQCDRECTTELTYNGCRILWIDSIQRGLSNSRNMALEHASADICVLADDDICFVEDYPAQIKRVFEETADADVIAFDTHKLHAPVERAPIGKRKKSSRFKYYGSVGLAFRRESLQKADVWFHTQFGAGAKYGSGEDSLMIRQARQKGLKIYEDPFYLAYVDYSSSTWFGGFDEKYYFQKGAFLEAAYGRGAWFYQFYYLLHSRKLSKLPAAVVLKNLREGRKDYRRCL